jgi:hypothetical protein
LEQEAEQYQPGDDNSTFEDCGPAANHHDCLIRFVMAGMGMLIRLGQFVIQQFLPGIGQFVFQVVDSFQVLVILGFDISEPFDKLHDQRFDYRHFLIYQRLVKGFVLHLDKPAVFSCYNCCEAWFVGDEPHFTEYLSAADGVEQLTLFANCLVDPNRTTDYQIDMFSRIAFMKDNFTLFIRLCRESSSFTHAHAP